MGIISSAIKKPDLLPRYYTSSELTFIQRMEGFANPILTSSNHYCAPHFITLYDNSISAPYKCPAITEDGKNIIPIFCTGDLGEVLYYKIVIPSDGTKVTMTAGKKPTLLYQTPQEASPIAQSFSNIIMSEVTKEAKGLFIKSKPYYTKIQKSAIFAKRSFA